MCSSGGAGSVEVHGALQSSLHAEWRPLAELAPMAADWRALAARALEPNVFYEPAFALAAAPVLGADVGAVLVWSRDTPSQLLGLFPARIERRRYGVKLPVLVGWTHPYAPFGAPLVDRDAAPAVIAAWLGHLGADARLPKLLLLPYLPLQGPLATALDAALAAGGGRWTDVARHERALLQPAADRAGYLERSLSAKRRRTLHRQRERLSETGSVRAECLTAPDAIASAFGDFLALEEAGWKGRAGSAAARHPEIARFMRQAVIDLAAAGQTQIFRLALDAGTCARPIAVAVMLRSGGTAWGWKIAYDEAFSRLSPGMQLLLDQTETLLDDAQFVRADSCAAADHSIVEHIWRERLPMGDRLIALPGAPFTLACALEGARRAAVTGAKALRDRLSR